MNREIKFRAWDIHKKLWIEPAAIGIDGNGVIHILQINHPLGRYTNKDLAKFIKIEWSTGLTDKNGKEGYKSDKISFGSTRPIYLVKWSVCNAGFYLESMDEQKEHLVISNLVVGEIIGSLHKEPQNGKEGDII